MAPRHKNRERDLPGAPLDLIFEETKTDIHERGYPRRVGRADELCGEDGADSERAIAIERKRSCNDLSGPVPALTKREREIDLSSGQ